jgi:hypothetical protein
MEMNIKKISLRMSEAADCERLERALPPAGPLDGVLEVYARAPDAATLRAVAAEWERATAQLPLEQRLDLLASLSTHVERGALSSRVLLPIVLGDTDARVVATAAARLALTHRADAADPEPGPFLVLKHLLTSDPRNLGAALGGLLGLGDGAVARWIFELRHLLALPVLSTVLDEMTGYQSSHLHKATVEFYLDWLEELAWHLPRSTETFRRVANGLINLRTSCLSDHVIDGQRRYPSPADGEPYEEGWHRIPLAEFTRATWPHLVALERAEQPPVAMRRVLEAWRPAIR